MLNIVFLDRTGIPATHDIPRPNFPHTWTEYATTSADQTFERVKKRILSLPAKCYSSVTCWLNYQS